MSNSDRHVVIILEGKTAYDSISALEPRGCAHHPHDRPRCRYMLNIDDMTEGSSNGMKKVWLK